MAFYKRDFRKDKPKPLRVRIVCGVKILTIPCWSLSRTLCGAGTSFERVVK